MFAVTVRFEYSWWSSDINDGLSHSVSVDDVTCSDDGDVEPATDAEIAAYTDWRNRTRKTSSRVDPSNDPHAYDYMDIDSVDDPDAFQIWLLDSCGSARVIVEGEVTDESLRAALPAIFDWDDLPDTGVNETI